ncbi:MAG: hypothetical protein MUP47_04585 [Phycisphaerae bacterium]|nr:hypothetical protein [Phycisphaerae bacterium]
MKNPMNQVLAELKRDKKRSVIMIVLAVVAAVLLARLLLKKSSPSTAAAAPGTEATAKAPGDEALWQAGVETAKRDDYFRKIDTTITRDIFVPPERYYPLPVTAKKPQPTTADSRSTEKENARKDATAMTLESTILSSTPKAIVDGQLVQVGDVIRGFRVERIGSRSVTLERGGVRVVLEMKGEP